MIARLFERAQHHQNATLVTVADYAHAVFAADQAGTSGALRDTVEDSANLLVRVLSERDKTEVLEILAEARRLIVGAET